MNPAEIIASRHLAFSRAAVLDAFTDPAKLALWWGPAGFRNTFDVCEPRPGGDWKLVMHAPDGTEYENESRFLEVGPQRVVIEHLRPMHRFVLTVEMTEEAGGTQVTWRQEFDSAEEVERVRQFVEPANEQNLDRLAALLAGES